MSSKREKGKKFIELLNERKKLEGTKVVNTSLNFVNSIYTVNRNYHELSEIISEYEKGLSIWDVKNRTKLDGLMIEFSRLLQNYLSSIYSLIEHTRIVCKDLNRINSSKEYSSKINALKEENCVWFVPELRTYSQHIRLHLITSQLSIRKNEETGQNEIEQKILLQKDEIIKWDKWSKKANEYIGSKKEINLKLVLAEYQALINVFYDWFYKEVGNLYAKELEEYHKITAELDRIAP